MVDFKYYLLNFIKFSWNCSLKFSRQQKFMKFYICSSIIMLAFASERSGAVSGLWKWPERGAERGAGRNRNGLSDGAANRPAHMLWCTVVECAVCRASPVRFAYRAGSARIAYRAALYAATAIKKVRGDAVGLVGSGRSLKNTTTV